MHSVIYFIMKISIIVESKKNSVACWSSQTEYFTFSYLLFSFLQQNNINLPLVIGCVFINQQYFKVKHEMFMKLGQVVYFGVAWLLPHFLIWQQYQVLNTELQNLEQIMELHGTSFILPITMFVVCSKPYYIKVIINC